jgi:hypothetical protein
MVSLLFNRGFKVLILYALSLLLVLGISGTVLAADDELDVADGAAEVTAFNNGDDIFNANDDTNNFLAVNIDGGDQITNIDSDFDGTLVLTDQSSAGTLTVSGFVDIARVLP